MLPLLISKGLGYQMGRHPSPPERGFLHENGPETAGLVIVGNLQPDCSPVDVGQPVQIHHSVVRMNILGEMIALPEYREELCAQSISVPIPLVPGILFAQNDIQCGKVAKGANGITLGNTVPLVAWW